MHFQNIEIHWLGHSGFLIKTKEGKRIYIDPYNINLSSEEPADLILITHPHYDHCSLEDINKIVKKGTKIVGPADIQSKIARLTEEISFELIDVGETVDLGKGIIVGAVPAYNRGKQFHPKEERWMGYLLKIGETTLYHAGDTDLIPEMEKLKGKVKVAFLPVGGNYTMNFQEAAEAAAIIHPEVAIPMHYGSDISGTGLDAENFKKLTEKKGLRVEILEKE